MEAFTEFRGRAGGLGRLWRYYPVMLCLDIPFQVLNFALLTALSDAVRGAGVPTTILSRLFCGVACGMISAGVTCPVDVCKTRILARDKAALAATATSSTPMEPEDATESLERDALAVTLIPAAVEAIEAESTVLVAERPQLVSAPLEEPSPPPLEVLAVPPPTANNKNVLVELVRIYREEGVATLFLGLRPRLLYTGLANGIRLAAYGTSRMDLMMRSLDDI